jgi:hypothetical protein
MPLSNQTDSVDKNRSVFGKLLWRIQNFLNKTSVRDAEIATPRISIEPQREIDKQSGTKEILPDTSWNLVDIIREGVSFEVPKTREIRYKQYREMVKTNELLSTVVDIYVDNITISDSVDGNILHIDSKNEDIKNELEGLFFDRINIEDAINDIVYETVLLGESFWEVVPTDLMNGINYIRKLYCPEKIHRIEKDGRLIAWYVLDDTAWTGPTLNQMTTAFGSTYQDDSRNTAIDISSLSKYFKDGNVQQGRILAPWQIVHFRIANRIDDFTSYGRSILAPCIYTWQLLRPLEDSLVVYRIIRAPERYRFYVECGNMSSEESMVYLHRLKDVNNKESFIDPASGQINKKYLALDALSNYYFPMRNGQKSIEMDTIAAGQNLGEINDIEWFAKKLRIASKVPQAYLQEETTDARTRPLSQLDIQFAKTIQRIQRCILKGLTKIAIEHLYLSGYEDKLKEFKLSLTVPSALEKQIRYELFGQKFQLASSIASSNMWSRYTIQRKILGMTAEEAEYESQLILWQENNLMPSEGAAASMFIDKDVNDIKDRIQNMAAQKQGTEPSGMDLGGLDLGGGSEMGGGMGAPEPTGGAPAGGEELPELPEMPAGEAEQPPMQTAHRLRDTSGTMLTEWNNAHESLKNSSSVSSKRGIIHLFNEGEIDGLRRRVILSDNKTVDVLFESFLKNNLI